MAEMKAKAHPLDNDDTLKEYLENRLRDSQLLYDIYNSIMSCHASLEMLGQTYKIHEFTDKAYNCYPDEILRAAKAAAGK